MDTQSLVYQLRLTHGVLMRNVAGISHAQSLEKPGGAGNCLNWIVGHLYATRSALSTLLGLEALWSTAEVQPYKRGSAELDPTQARDFAELVSRFDEAQATLLEALRAVSAERLAEPAPFSPTKNPHETILTLLANLLFHEAYHAGQAGLLRRQLGFPGAIA
jgi:uncharacterized damage-inducible protein DinB